VFIKNQPLALVLNQLNPVHSLYEIDFNIIFLSVTASKLVSSPQGCQTTFSLMPWFLGYRCAYGRMFCILLFNSVGYVFLL